MHPRFAHMVLRGEELGAAELAAVLAALLSERDILRGSAESADVKVGQPYVLKMWDLMLRASTWAGLFNAFQRYFCQINK